MDAATMNVWRMTFPLSGFVRNAFNVSHTSSPGNCRYGSRLVEGAPVKVAMPAQQKTPQGATTILAG
jgi:hypothetical protein